MDAQTSGFSPFDLVGPFLAPPQMAHKVLKMHYLGPGSKMCFSESEKSFLSPQGPWLDPFWSNKIGLCAVPFQVLAHPCTGN